MDNEKVKRICGYLEEALLKETCTFEEAKQAVDRLRSIYFERKAGKLLKRITVQELASVEI